MWEKITWTSCRWAKIDIFFKWYINIVISIIILCNKPLNLQLPDPFIILTNGWVSQEVLLFWAWFCWPQLSLLRYLQSAWTSAGQAFAHWPPYMSGVLSRTAGLSSAPYASWFKRLGWVHSHGKGRGREACRVFSSLVLKHHHFCDILVANITQNMSPTGKQCLLVGNAAESQDKRCGSRKGWRIWVVVSVSPSERNLSGANNGGRAFKWDIRH